MKDARAAKIAFDGAWCMIPQSARTSASKHLRAPQQLTISRPAINRAYRSRVPKFAYKIGRPGVACPFRKAAGWPPGSSVAGRCGIEPLAGDALGVEFINIRARKSAREL